MTTNDESLSQGNQVGRDKIEIGSISGNAKAAIGEGAHVGDIHLPPRTTPLPPAFQVPYPQSSLFVGRRAELQTLAAVLLADAASTVAVLPAVSGLGGMGKTQLASEFAHRYRNQFPGGVFWLNMEQVDTISAQVAACAGPGGLELHGWQVMDLDTKIAAVKRAWCEPIRRLLVLDNIVEPQLLAEWRPVSGGTRVLITTRRGAWAARTGVQPLPLTILPRPESLRLLLEPRARRQLTTLDTLVAVPETASAADAICEELGDLPLAMALAAAYLESNPGISLQGYLTQIQTQLLDHPSLDAELEEGLPTKHAASITATVALSYMRLDATKDTLAIQLLHRTAQCASTLIPRSLLVNLVDADPDNVEDNALLDAPLGRLVALGLADLLEDSAVVHRLVAAFVRAHDTDVSYTINSVIVALGQELSRINEAGYPQAGAPYVPHAERMAMQTTLQETYAVGALLHGLGLLLEAQGDYPQARTYLERALQVYEHYLGSFHPDTAANLNSLGLVLQAQGNYSEARLYFERALQITEQVLGYFHRNTALILNNLGLALQAQGNYSEARLYFERALQITEQVLGPSHKDTATSLNNLGWLLQVRGNYSGARAYFERALRIYEQELGLAHLYTASSLNNLGLLLQAQGNYSEARLYFERALQITEQVLGCSHPDTARCLNNMGGLLQAQGVYLGAQDYFERALQLYEQVLGYFHPHTAMCLNNLGGLFQVQQDFPAARRCFERALRICEQELGHRHPDTVNVRRNLALLDKAFLRHYIRSKGKSR
jgi:tetratricopeptide (TPR) repeat protein